MNLNESSLKSSFKKNMLSAKNLRRVFAHPVAQLDVGFGPGANSSCRLQGTVTLRPM